MSVKINGEVVANQKTFQLGDIYPSADDSGAAAQQLEALLYPVRPIVEITIKPPDRIKLTDSGKEIWYLKAEEINRDLTCQRLGISYRA